MSVLTAACVRRAVLRIIYILRLFYHTRVLEHCRFTNVVQGQPEFLGRCTATPRVKLDEEPYDPAQLEWFDINRGVLKAGQLLASFELLEVRYTQAGYLEFSCTAFVEQR